MPVLEHRQRLHKLLAQVGYGSRRTIETWIRNGRLSVNGVVAQVGDKAGNNDAIMLDGKALSIKSVEKFLPRVIAYYKPEGQICTSNDSRGRDSVLTHMPVLKHARWIMIGRLDINSQGLLLLTNDGQLAHKLMHPSTGIEREYAVRIYGAPTQNQLKQLIKGMMLEDGMARFRAIEFSGGDGKNRWYHVILTEGRKREVRRLWEAMGFRVSRLVRIRYGSFIMDRSQKSRQIRELDIEEMRRLYNDAGLRLVQSPKSINANKKSRNFQSKRSNSASKPRR